jgi:hypothetical protein
MTCRRPWSFDFDARHRLVVSAIYELPFRGNRFAEGWQLAVILQAWGRKSGQPVNSTSTVNGVANTLRPDVTGLISIIGTVERWFDPTVFTAVERFGSLGATWSSDQDSTTRISRSSRISS